jgi:transposase-like protein
MICRVSLRGNQFRRFPLRLPFLGLLSPPGEEVGRLVREAAGVGGTEVTTISNRKERRIWKPADKLRIVPETISSDAKLAEICRREGLSPALVYQWPKALMKSAEQVFARKKPGNSGLDPPPWSRWVGWLEKDQTPETLPPHKTAERISA